MSPRFKGQWRPSLFKLMLMFSLSLMVCVGEAARRTNEQVPHSSFLASLSDESDPMEPCYLANNRASESLTISESTPVGTVVGEIMVNGDSSPNGNIELSIRMPGGNGGGSNNLQVAGSSGPDTKIAANGLLAVGTQRQQQQQLQTSTNGFTSTYSTSSSPLAAAKRIGEPHPTSGGQPTAAAAASNTKSAKELSNLIDLMPPLSIDHGTKQLILAKRLDRENLDRYIMAGGYQSSSSLGSLSQSSSSASLTVHIKCQLKTVSTSASNTSSSTNGTMMGRENLLAIKRNSNSANSILIPVHLIVIDENDNWPVFLNSPYIIDLNETAQSGSILPGNEIIAVDSDQQGPLSTIEYSVVAGSFWSDSFAFLNPLDSRSLVVKDNRLLDYEGQSKITLKVMARDQGEPPNWAITSLHINLFDNDDLSPVFNEDKYFGQVRDNRPGETIELLPKRMFARDGDKTINAPVIYTFHTKTNHSIHFDLDPDLGQLTLRKTLPEDQVPSGQLFCLLVKATQLDNPQRWTLAMINMRLSHSSNSPLEQLLAIDQQQNNMNGLDSSSSTTNIGLKFSHSNVTVEISESAPPGFTVHRMRAFFNHQAFPTESDQVVYHLLDDEMKYFNLDERSGRLSLNKSLDYELYRRLSVRILATYEYYDDHHSPSSARNRRVNTDAAGSQTNYPKMICDITRININIINENDFAPEFSHEQYNFQLSVSDLIANFEPLKAQSEQQVDESSEIKVGSKDPEAKLLSKRFGDFELDDYVEEPLDWRAMQLGHIYCADRDYSDKVTLQLAGSKADLFHLTQDGRLYLPLVNISAADSLAMNSMRRNDLFSSSRSVNNQFIQSRFASPRRIDSMQLSPELPDRKYLNHLLSEFSNLGRLRLKVVATDDGRPKVHQSRAIVVITIISIENFIIQRVPQLPSVSSPGPTIASDGAIQLTNQTSYDVNQVHSAANQVMMIPATSGRSFVQINPDIITNLIAQSTLHNNNSINNRRESSQTTNSSSTATNGIDTLQLSSSKNSANINNPAAVGGESTHQNQANSARFQPPSLLLVDDDGAKFVAMPAAIEVYNQQVQEAADLSAREKNSNLNSGGSSRRSNDQESSLWYHVKDYLGFVSHKPDSAQRSSFYSILNLSTAIMLHLIGFVLIITLVSRIRSSIRSSNGFSSSLWPTTFSTSFPRLLGRPSNGQSSIVSIFDQPASCTYSARPSSSDSSERSSYTFLNHHHNQTTNSNATHHHRQFVRSEKTNQSFDLANSESSAINYQTSHQSSKMVSRGTVVSAIFNGYNTSKSPSTSPGVRKFCETIEDSKQQNLFSHLKVTLNKMLESNEDSKEPATCIGHVTIRALDSDSIAAVGNSNYSSNHLAMATNQDTSTTQIPDTVVEVKASRSSTFVGVGNQPLRSPSTPNGNQSCESATAVVSISVPAPKRPHAIESSSIIDINTTEGELKLPNSNKLTGTNGSSSSSVISLVSMSSSISNKINAAVERTNDHTTTGSDVSSLDSTTLFDGVQSNSSPENCGKASRENVCREINTILAAKPVVKPKPKPPPPPPPPPVLTKMSIELIEQQQQQKVPSMSNKNQLIDNRLFGNLSDSGQQLATATSLSATHARKPLPQNPTHVKLKQQAAVLATGQAFAPTADSDNIRKRGNSHNDLETSQIQSTESGQVEEAGISRGKDGYLHTTGVATNTALLPPAPPPLPAHLPAPNIKTVSPTTSVDRGYESFQSYTSSSQQQHQRSSYADQMSRQNNNDLTQKGGIIRSYAGRSLPAIPPPPSASSNGNPVVGRQIQSSINSLRAQQKNSEFRYNSNSHSLGQQTSGQQQLSEEHPAYRFGKPNKTIPDAPSSEVARSFAGGGSTRFKRTSKTLAAAAVAAKHRNGLSTLTRDGSSQHYKVHTFTKSHSKHRSTNSMLNGDTEDEDFYYCYDQNQAQTASTRPNIHQYDGTSSLLKDYASHTYKQQQPRQPKAAGARQLVMKSAPVQGRASSHPTKSTNGSDLMISQPTALFQVTNADMHSSHYNYHKSHQYQQQRHHRHQQSSRQLHQTSHLANGHGTAGKKQLTWSDQVEIA